MSIDITQFDADDRIDREQWNDYIRRSRGGTVFHTFDMLELIERHASADLYPFIGYKGQEPVGVFPLFVVRKGPVSTAFSPPPSLKITYLGPALLNAAKLKPSKAERRNRRFVEAALDYVDEHVGPRYVHVRTHTRYSDTRPFTWNGFESCRTSPTSST